MRNWLEENTFSQAAREYWRYTAESGLCNSSDRFSPLEVFQQIATIGGLRRLETADYEKLFSFVNYQEASLGKAETLLDRPCKAETILFGEFLNLFYPDFRNTQASYS